MTLNDAKRAGKLIYPGELKLAKSGMKLAKKTTDAPKAEALIEARKTAEAATDDDEKMTEQARKLSQRLAEANASA